DRLNAEGIALLADAENPFDASAIEPARRTRVPRPAAAADVALGRTHVAGNDVGLDLVPLDGVGAVGLADGVQHREELGGAGAVAKHCFRNQHPDGAMGILPAVFAKPGGVALDVAWLERGV